MSTTPTPLRGAIPRNATFQYRLAVFLNKGAIVSRIGALLKSAKKVQEKTAKDYFRDPITGKILPSS